MSRGLAGAFVLLAVGLCAAAQAQAESISAMTCGLQALQVKIATGDRVAYANQIEQLKAIGAAIEAAKPQVWQAKSETDAAVIYLLSGGRTGDIVRLLESGGVPRSETPLMRGALAYIVGDQAQARTLLGDLDPRSLDLRLAGQIAFVQSVLAGPRNAKKAIGLLDLARLLAPGGLVEEASLRREIALVADQHDTDRFTMLSRQYAMRFGRSIFADRFLQGLAYRALDAKLVDDIPSFQKFHSFVTSLTPAARSRFLLTVARAEAVDGKFAVASAAAGEALQEAPGDSAQEARGKLYQASARILTPEYDDGLVELQSVAAAKLDTRDQSLLDAVRDVATRLRQPLSEPPGGSPAPPAAKGGDDPAAATIALAEAALSRTAGQNGAAGKGNP